MSIYTKKARALMSTYPPAARIFLAQDAVAVAADNAQAMCDSIEHLSRADLEHEIGYLNSFLQAMMEKFPSHPHSCPVCHASYKQSCAAGEPFEDDGLYHQPAICDLCGAKYSVTDIPF
jgi:hypothetical protein